MKEGPLCLYTSKEGLVLRQIQIYDAPAMFTLIDSDRVHLSQWGENTAEKYQTLDDVRHSITNPLKPTRRRFGIWDNGVYVGNIAFEPMGVLPSEECPNYEVGYWVGSKFVRRGYATFATITLLEHLFRTTPAKRVFAYVHCENVASQRVLDKAGFQFLRSNPPTNVFKFERPGA